MRPIKFRGKTLKDDLYFKEGEWIYGSLQVYKGYSIFSIFDNITSNFVAVKSNTIGQYTGFHDKNGKEIYEGDIVKYKDLVINKYKIMVTEFNAIHASFLWLYDSGMELQYEYIDEGKCNRCEVIGNIYENPELLEMEE